MRPVRFGGVLFALLLAGCQAGSARPAQSAPVSPSLRPTVKVSPTAVPSTSPGSASVSARLQGPVSNDYNPLYCGVRRAASGQPASVLLTIDDFPYQDGEKMVKIAQWAKQTNTMMMAFPISGPVAAYDKAHHTDLVARTRALGTYVGNHTYSHPDLRAIPLNRAESEISHGIASTYLRPPYGAYTRAVRTYVERQQHARICYWTIDLGDWQKKNGAYPAISTLLSRARAQLKQAKPGMPIVILGHYYSNYPEALPGIRKLVSGLNVCPAPASATTAQVPYPIC